MYTLNLYNFICQAYLNKAGEKEAHMYQYSREKSLILHIASFFSPKTDSTLLGQSHSKVSTCKAFLIMHHRDFK